MSLISSAMVRGLSASPALAQQLETLWAQRSDEEEEEEEEEEDGEKDGFIAGFVVGQRLPPSAKEDLVAHLAPTPAPEDDDEEAEADSTKKREKPSSVDSVDVEWMLEHHAQMERMLPGGLDVIGVFFVSDHDGDEALNSLGRLRKVLRGLANRSPSQRSQKDFVVLHLSRLSQQVSARWIDPSSEQHQSRPAEFRLEKRPHGWLRVQGTFLLDLPVAFSAEEEATRKTLLKDKVETALTSLEKCVEDAFVVFDGSYRAAAEMLDPEQLQQQQVAKPGKSARGKKGRRSKVADKEEEEEEEEGEEDGEEGVQKTFEAEILLQDDVAVEGGDCLVESIAARMRFAGKLHTRAYLHSRATVAEATSALKADVIRSLRGRFRMHCDSLVGEETGGPETVDTPVLHEPPRRVMVEFPYCEGVCLSDYLFPGETPYDSNDSVEEIFGFRPPIEAFDDEIELVAGPIETRETLGSDSAEDSRAPSPSDVVSGAVLNQNGRCGPIVLLSAAAAAFAAVAAGYFLISGGKGDLEQQQGLDPEDYIEVGPGGEEGGGV